MTNHPTVKLPYWFHSTLQAVVHSLPAPRIRGEYDLADVLGIKFFSMKAIKDPRSGRDVGVVIGPREDWLKAKPAHLLKAYEAWRTLKALYPEAAVTLLASVPEHQGEFTIFRLDWSNLWAVGWHATKNWYWHIPNVFHVLGRKTEPDAAMISSQSDQKQSPFHELWRFARNELKGQQYLVLMAVIDNDGKLPLERVQEVCKWHKLTNDRWKCLRQRLNEKLRPLGWEIRTHNHVAQLVKS